MRYLGGKSKIAKRLAKAILEHTPRRGRLIEPFVGGGAMTAALAPHFERVEASDIHEDLTLMWQALQTGWVPPETISENEYRDLRSGGPSPLRAFAGFGASWGGKWFGGYARGCGRNYADESRRSMLRDINSMANVKFTLKDYRDIEIRQGDVVYADPPYSGTTEYREIFDNNKFWEIATGWSLLGADVYVSEYAAPPKWIPILSLSRTRDMRSDLISASTVTENLFIPPSGYDPIADVWKGESEARALVKERMANGGPAWPKKDGQE